MESCTLITGTLRSLDLIGKILVLSNGVLFIDNGNSEDIELDR